MSLSEKSEEELSSLLAEYGIKHGPVVDSTRKLYERKLQQAMEKASVQPSSDKTYYREEEEEITYVTYHSPVKHEAVNSDVYSCRLKQRSKVEAEEDEELNSDTEPPVTQSANTAVNRNIVQSTGVRQPLAKKSGGCVWELLKLLLLVAVFTIALYYVLCRVAFAEDYPFSTDGSDL